MMFKFYATDNLSQTNKIIIINHENNKLPIANILINKILTHRYVIILYGKIKTLCEIELNFEFRSLLFLLIVLFYTYIYFYCLPKTIGSGLTKIKFKNHELK